MILFELLILFFCRNLNLLLGKRMIDAESLDIFEVQINQIQNTMLKKRDELIFSVFIAFF
jgi:hypothetical protein